MKNNIQIVWIFQSKINETRFECLKIGYSWNYGMSSYTFPFWVDFLQKL